MNFTREPIIETIITPKEGHKLLVRNSKETQKEEFNVDALEVISFGSHSFYRSTEKPRAFLVPVSDYEVLEVRETKMVLKMPEAQKGGVKIGGGRAEQPQKGPKEEEESSEESGKGKRDKKRFRKRKERLPQEEETTDAAPSSDEPKVEEPKTAHVLIPPPTTLISETIARYKDVPNFAGAFFEKEEAKATEEVAVTVPDEEPESVPPAEEEEEMEDFYPRDLD